LLKNEAISPAPNNEGLHSNRLDKGWDAYRIDCERPEHQAMFSITCGVFAAFGANAKQFPPPTTPEGIAAADKARKAALKAVPRLGYKEAPKVQVRTAQILRLQAGAYIRPHSGPDLSRLVTHLGLQVPKCAAKNPPCLTLACGGKNLKGDHIAKSEIWEEGKLMFFDDSFEHEVKFEGVKGVDEDRIVLAMQITNPSYIESLGGADLYEDALDNKYVTWGKQKSQTPPGDFDTDAPSEDEEL